MKDKQKVSNTKIEDEENAKDGLLLATNRDDTNASHQGFLKPDDDNFTKILEENKNADALDDLRRQSLAKGATDEEAEKLLKQLDDKM